MSSIWPKKYEDYGVEAIIYTDIGRDGMLSGINIEATVKLAQALLIPVIASGGLSSLDDIRRLCAVEEEGISAAIAGRAIYDGSLDFAAAQAEPTAGQIHDPPASSGQTTAR
jgi:phosphoribosylformimino-5-aminoimidazole carboxamide ribotide isomerase